jgi:hypothetical protein
VIAVDDAPAGFADPDGNGMVTVKGLDLSAARSVSIRSGAAAPTGCN